jgi:PAS domain S-box-containing protein
MTLVLPWKSVQIRTQPLQCVVALLCATFGTLMLVAPHQFDSPVYAPLRANLNLWGYLFLTAGASLMAVAILGIHGRFNKAIGVLSGGALLGLGMAFGVIGAWSGLAFYSVLGLGALLAGFDEGERDQKATQYELLELAVGVATALIGTSMLTLPDQFRAPTYDAVRSVVIWFGAAFLTSGVLLLLAQVRSQLSRQLSLVARLCTAATLLTYLGAVAVPQRAWTGVVLYACIGVALLVAPVVSRRVTNVDGASLRVRLALALCGAATLPLIVAFSLYAQEEEALVTSSVVAQHQLLAESLAGNVADDATADAVAAATLANTPSLLDMPASSQIQLLRSTRLPRRAFAFAIFDSQGGGITRSDARALTSIAGSSMYEQIRRGAPPSFSLILPTDPTLPIFGIAAPIWGPSGELQGLVVVESDQTAGILAAGDAGPGGSIYFANGHGQPILGADFAVAAPTDEAASASVLSAFPPHGPTSAPPGYASSQSWLAGSATIPNSDWMVVVEQPALSALADVRSNRELLFGVLLLAATLAAASGFFVAKLLAEPLNSLANAVERLGSGESNAPLPHSRITEVRRLARNFGVMRDQLHSRSAERDQAEMAVRESEERARAIIDTAMDAVISMDSGGRIIGWNPQAESVFGWPRESVLGQSLVDIIFPAGARDTQQLELLRSLPSGGEPASGQRVEVSVVRRNGEHMVVELSATAVRAGNTYTVNAFLRDTTERKRAEEAKSRLAAIVQSSDDAIIGKTLDGVITSWNFGAERLYGYTADEVVGRSISLLVPPDHSDELPEILAHVRRGERVLRIETVRMRKDASLINVALTVSPVRDETGAITGAAAIGHDITAMYRAAQRQRLLAESSLAFAEAVTDFPVLLERVARLVGGDTGNSCVVRLLSEDGSWAETGTSYNADPELHEAITRVMIASRSADQTLWHTVVQEKRVVRLDLEPGEVPTDTSPQEAAFLQRYRPRTILGIPLIARRRCIGRLSVVRYEQSAPIEQADELLLMDLAGRAAVAIDSAQLYVAEKQALIAAHAAVEETGRERDHVARLQALERHLQEKNGELEAAAKELEAFSYSVSHDLRAPLRAVSGFSRILLDEHAEQLPDEAKRYLQRVSQGAQEMGQLIDDLLAFSRMGRTSLQKQTVQPAALVHRVLAELEADIDERQVDVEVGALLPCQADAALLKQVYVNLIGNALKFTRRHQTARIEIGCKRVDDQTIYFVKDNGAGFDMRYADKLFGVFQRLHRAEEYDGTGVGLAIVQRIVHRHGGRIWADSVVDQGATFSFTLEGSHTALSVDTVVDGEAAGQLQNAA